ncbi:MAG: hypothetical protein LBN30_00120 [Oscillospiraceae bacterium]|jgi:DNA-directed RNA polymerase subunit RPC12/RpoP|nr:hypothetical protein [Oscillospiraceae bacterium]
MKLRCVFKGHSVKDCACSVCGKEYHALTKNCSCSRCGKSFHVFVDRSKSEWQNGEWEGGYQEGGTKHAEIITSYKVCVNCGLETDVNISEGKVFYSN